MIDLLYQLTRKGWLKALSFILACAMFAAILWNAGTFARVFGGAVPYLAIVVFYGMSILWIHGIGFDIKSKVWRLIFMPLIGYGIMLWALIYTLLNR